MHWYYAKIKIIIILGGYITMSLYGRELVKESLVDSDIENIDLKPYIELMAYDDISRGSDEQIASFLESELCQVLQERQVLNKKAMIRLDRDADEKRRIKLAAYQLAKENNDPAFKKLVMYREKMKEQRAIIMKKYGKQAKKIAVKSQKEYIKNARKEPATQADNAK